MGPNKKQKTIAGNQSESRERDGQLVVQGFKLKAKTEYYIPKWIKAFE